MSKIEEAAGEGANIVAFSESWLGGYPFYIWAGNPGFTIQFQDAFIETASMTATDPRWEILKSAAKKNNIAVVMGFNLKAFCRLLSCCKHVNS